MKDLLAELAAVHRGVAREKPSDADELVRVVLRRSYRTTRQDLWEALTDPERVARWFMPITGDLTVGGHFQLEGNAGGDIVACDPPRMWQATFGGPASVITVTLTETADGCSELLLEHTVPLAMAGSVAGALCVGPGWDGALLGLARHVAGDVIGDPVAAASTPEATEYARQSVQRWAEVAAGSGADAEEVEAARLAALTHFAPAGD